MTANLSTAHRRSHIPHHLDNLPLAFVGHQFGLAALALDAKAERDSAAQIALLRPLGTDAVLGAFVDAVALEVRKHRQHPEEQLGRPVRRDRIDAQINEDKIDASVLKKL